MPVEPKACSPSSLVAEAGLVVGDDERLQRRLPCLHQEALDGGRWQRAGGITFVKHCVALVAKLFHLVQQILHLNAGTAVQGVIILLVFCLFVCFLLTKDKLINPPPTPHPHIQVTVKI